MLKVQDPRGLQRHCGGRRVGPPSSPGYYYHYHWRRMTEEEGIILIEEQQKRRELIMDHVSGCWYVHHPYNGIVPGCGGLGRQHHANNRMMMPGGYAAAAAYPCRGRGRGRGMGMGMGMMLRKGILIPGQYLEEERRRSSRSRTPITTYDSPLGSGGYFSDHWSMTEGGGGGGGGRLVVAGGYSPLPPPPPRGGLIISTQEGRRHMVEEQHRRFVVDHHSVASSTYLCRSIPTTTPDRTPRGWGRLTTAKKKKKWRRSRRRIGGAKPSSDQNCYYYNNNYSGGIMPLDCTDKQMTRRRVVGRHHLHSGGGGGHPRRWTMMLPLEEEVVTSPEKKVKKASCNFHELIPLDVLVEILARLPTRSLLRCTCVCKSWRAIIQSRRFVDRHLLKRSEMPNLNIVTLSWMPWIHEFSLHYFDEDCHKLDMRGQLSKEEEEEEFYGRYEISNSCNGLVCVFGPTRTFVVNPSIRRGIELPEAKYENFVNVALGYDTSTGVYKVVRTFTSSSSVCMVFTLGTSHSWRLVGDLPFQADWATSPVVVAAAANNNSSSSNGCNVIVWMIDPLWGRYRGAEIAVSFDVESETFDTIVHPEGSSRSSRASSIMEVGGYLCILETPAGLEPESNWQRNELWILTDYANRRWIKVKDGGINFESAENMSCGMSVGLTLLGIRDGKILMTNGKGRFDFYDMEAGCFDKPPMYLTYGRATPYVESLISPVTIHQENNVDAAADWGSLPPPSEDAAILHRMKCGGKPWWWRLQQQQRDGSWRQWSFSDDIIPYDVNTADEAVWPVSTPKGLIVYS